jgi:hypothetical protein
MSAIRMPRSTRLRKNPSADRSGTCTAHVVQHTQPGAS